MAQVAAGVKLDAFESRRVRRDGSLVDVSVAHVRDPGRRRAS